MQSLGRCAAPLLALALAASCDSGDSTTGTTQLLAGDFVTVSIGTENEEAWPHGGALAPRFDGAGKIVWAGRGPYFDSAPYTSGTDGSFATDGAHGFVGAGGDVMVIGSTRDVEFRAGVRIDPTVFRATLAGDYAAYAFEGFDGGCRLLTLALSADGNGVLDWKTLRGGTGEGTLVYDVWGGVVTVHGNLGDLGDAPGEIVGAVSASGEVFVLSDPDGAVTATFLAIRKSAGAGADLLRGAYRCHAFELEAYGYDHSCWVDTATVEADGAGSYRLVNSGGEEAGLAGSYTVLADGTVLFDNGLEGIVSADGETLVLMSGPTLPDVFVLLGLRVP